jgi:hypothetical protein
MSDLRNGASSVSEDFPCAHCDVLVYWGPHYAANGDMTRKLFTRATYRVHDCSAKPDENAFDVVQE